MVVWRTPSNRPAPASEPVAAIAWRICKSGQSVICAFSHSCVRGEGVGANTFGINVVDMNAINLLAAISLAVTTPVDHASAKNLPAVRLYTLDCGHLDLDDMGLFDSAQAGRRGAMAVPCYLVRDGDGWLLWDTGLGDALAASPRGRHILGGQWTVRHTLVSQLARLRLTPRDIDFVALSHLHADHSGNIGLFTDRPFCSVRRSWVGPEAAGSAPIWGSSAGSHASTSGR